MEVSPSPKSQFQELIPSYDVERSEKVTVNVPVPVVVDAEKSAVGLVSAIVAVVVSTSVVLSSSVTVRVTVYVPSWRYV